MRGRSPIVNIMAEEDSQQLFRFDSIRFDYLMVLFIKSVSAYYLQRSMREKKLSRQKLLKMHYNICWGVFLKYN
jgi:hypothetical protein